MDLSINQSTVQLIECPRDAMQGWKSFIPTGKKIAYINSLLKVGFHTIDFGSFVSAKAIPQMADTVEVLKGLDIKGSSSKLLAIVANTRGAEEAAAHAAIHYLGFPFSVSETFQQRNTNSSIQDSLKRVEEIQKICTQQKKEMVVYLSMGFGNPYGDPYSKEIVFGWAKKIAELDINIISLSDTVGLASPEQVFSMTDHLIKYMPEQRISVHLHSSPNNRIEKLEAAWKAGCRRFDGALNGIGGCPMANDELVGNMDTGIMICFFQQKNQLKELNMEAFAESIRMANEIFV